jgi:hypothetical protein
MARALIRRGNRVVPGALHIKKRVGDRVLERLVLATPVDVSTALSNWQVTTTTPIFHAIDAYMPGDQGSTKMVSVAQAFSVGSKIIRTVGPGAPLLISNVLGYIETLGAGYSRQARAGWIGRAVRQGSYQGVGEALASRSVI